jgi:iron complex outermembrane recepter protein
MEKNMHRKTPYKRSLLYAAISLSLLPLASQSIAQEDTVEEIVVTGSFIRRTEGFRAASPITQISALEIADAGTPNMGDIIHNLSFNAGTTTSANAFTGASNGSTSLNLRGLGAGATLDLTDGMRQLSGDINSALPYIGIQRLDIVTDGAAALYGSAAVAGVVNYVPYKSYDGLKLEHMSNADSEGDYNEVQFGMLWGTEFNGIDIVVAADWRENSRLEMRDRPDTLNSAFVWSSTATPGDYNVPVRDAAGNLTGGTTKISDPGCGDENAAGPPSQIKNGEFGFTQRSGCSYDYGEFWDYQYPLQRGNLFTSASYDFSDDFSLNATYQYTREQSQVRGSPINPGGRVGELPAIRGEIPGNPYPALDANGNQLYAMDANGDGVPDRAGGDPYGAVMRSDALNGIPFNEDVTFNSWRPWAKHGTVPSIFNSDGSSPRKGQDWAHRYTLQADFAVPFLNGWEGAADYMYAKSTSNDKQYEGSLSGLKQGLNCDVANDRNACFTPFVTNAADANTVAVADSTVNYQRGYYTNDMSTFDLVINGSVLPSFELPGGSVGAAFGYQRRNTAFNQTPAAFQQQDDQWIGAQALPLHDSRHVDSIFAEFAVPILDNLQLSLAVRNEEYSTGQSSTDPKYGIVYSPLQSLSFRASAGTSFIAPSLSALNRPEGCGLQNLSDPFGTFASFTSSCSSGNPNLTPEQADTLSYGFDWDIMEGMSLSVTYSETDFTDRIVSTSGQDILDLDYFAWRTSTSKADGVLPTLSEMNAWLGSGADPRIIRNPTDPFVIDRVYNGSSNASSMLVEAYDVDFRYSFDLPEILGVDDLGTWTVGLQATYLEKYEYQLSPLESVEQAVGHQSAFTGAVPPMPRIKGTARIGWSRGSHSASLNGRYLHDLRYDGYSGFYTGYAGFNLNSDVVSRNPTRLRKSTIADFAYNYRGYEALGGELNFTVGSRNVFDRMPQRMPMLGGTESILYDAMGRTIYARITFEM